MPAAIRIDQLLSRFGYCSRREAAAWVAAGRVTLNGEPITRTDTKAPTEAVLVDGAPVEFPEGLLVMLHKPVGYACSHDTAEAPLIYDLLPPQWLRRNPAPISIGRLDRDTSGLLLITDDGALSHRLTSPKHEVEKCYEVAIGPERTIPAELIPLFASGTLHLKGESKPCRPARLQLTGPHTATLHLHEGKYHQVRRMFASQGLTVTSLHRSAFGPLTLKNLPPGQWRPFTCHETAQIESGEPPPTLPG